MRWFLAMLLLTVACVVAIDHWSASGTTDHRTLKTMETRSCTLYYYE